MSYVPGVSRSLTDGLDTLGDAGDEWSNNLWADADHDIQKAPVLESHTAYARNQIPSKDSTLTNGVQEFAPTHARSSTGPILDASGRSGLRSRKVSAHRRAATIEDSTAISRLDPKAKQARAHPLQVPKTPTDRDAFVTRPSLKRWLSNGAKSLSRTDDGLLDAQEYAYSTWETQTKEAETMVIVHEVTKADSLAGVALKYGIALADLRRVNHLWASDPIHLRKVLYIPVHLTSKKLAIAESQLTNGQSSPLEEELGSSNSLTFGGSTPSVVQRVPISQLSFFPPSSSKSTPASASSINSVFASSASNPYATSPRISRARSATANGTIGPSLSSFLQTIQQQFTIPTLPLPLSRPRISLDSTDISSSTGTAPGSEGSSDQEHEMNVLRQHKSRTELPFLRPRASEKISMSSAGVHWVEGDPSDVLFQSALSASHNSPKARSAATSRKHMGLSGVSSISIPSQLQPPLIDTGPSMTVTEQMKPSPRMELPRSSS